MVEGTEDDPVDRAGKVQVSFRWLLEELGLNPRKHQIVRTVDHDAEYYANYVTFIVEGEKMPEHIDGHEIEKVVPYQDDEGNVTWKEDGL